MARKNNSREEGSIHFDTRTRTVMAEFKQDNLKEKLKAVREVVPGKKRDELVMVLQYFEYNVEKTIQAYLEDGAKKVLNEWSHTQTNRKGKGRQKERPDPKAKEAAAKTPIVNGTADEHADDDTVPSDSNIPNGHVPQGLENGDSETHSTSIHPSATTTTAPPQPQRPHQQSQPQQQRGDRGKGGKGHRESHSVHHNAVKLHHQRERTMSERSNASSVYGGEHGHQSLDKSFKDLQRQTTSLERLKHLLDSEMDRSSKTVKKVFDEIRKGLDDRESKVLAELDVVKTEASEMVDSRHTKAMDLKRLVERAERMSEAQISEVRSEIKHFVTDRRHDEELGRTTRFMYDSDHMLKEVQKFGEVIHIPKAVSRPVSTTLSIGHNNGSGDSSNHNGVAGVEERLKNSLNIQNSSSTQQTAPPNGPKNKGSNDKTPRGEVKSPQSRKSTTTATSPQPPQSSSSSSSATPQASSPKSQRPQQQRQRQRRTDSILNHRPRTAVGASNGSRGPVLDARRLANPDEKNNRPSSSSRGGGSGSSTGGSNRGRGGSSARGRGGAGTGRGGGGYRGNPQQQSSQASSNVRSSNGTSTSTSTPQPAAV